MIYTLYAIRDKFQGFMSPQPDQSDESAKRNFAFAINNNPGIMGFAPADFDLFAVGSFDSQSGKVTEIVQQFICNGQEVFNEK